MRGYFFISLQAHEVYEHDTFEYELGLNPKLKHIPALTNRGDVILYYAVIKFKNGGEGFEVMSKEAVSYTHLTLPTTERV